MNPPAPKRDDPPGEETETTVLKAMDDAAPSPGVPTITPDPEGEAETVAATVEKGKEPDGPAGLPESPPAAETRLPKDEAPPLLA
ncbi:hypothetical protein ACUOA8_40790, partial [Escherichia sp. SS-MK2]